MRFFETWSMTRTVFVVFACASGFTTGALFRLGHGMIALVDKAHLLLLLAFYGSVASFLIHLCISMYALAWSQRNLVYAARQPVIKFFYSFRRLKGYSAKRKLVTTLSQGPSFSRTAMTIYFVGVSGPLAGILVYIAIRNWDHLQRMRAIGGVLDGVVIFAVFLAAISAAVWSMPERHKHLRSRLFGYVIAFGAFFALAASYQLGGYWVRYLQVLGPRISLYIEGVKKPVSASIAFAANDGLIFFVEGTDYPVQYPWSSIRRIDGEPVSERARLF